MRPRRSPVSNKVFRLPGGNEDNDLWVEETEDTSGQPVICSLWVPSDEEREQIAGGGNVELLVWGTGTPPVAVSVTDQRPGSGA